MSLLEACLPGRPPHNVGVLLIDPATDRGWVRFRRAVRRHRRSRGRRGSGWPWKTIFATPWPAPARKPGCGRSRTPASNALRVGERQAVAVDAFTRVLDRAFRRACGAHRAGALPDAPAALQHARGRRVCGEEMEPGGGRLGARAGGHAPGPRSHRRARGGALHGTADSATAA